MHTKISKPQGSILSWCILLNDSQWSSEFYYSISIFSCPNNLAQSWWFKTIEMYSYTVQQEVWNPGVSGTGSFWGWIKSCLSPSFWWLPAIFPQLIDTSFLSLSFIFMLPFLCFCPLLLLEHLQLDIEFILNPGYHSLEIFKLTTSVKAFFP
jgi:hypothetical protein